MVLRLFILPHQGIRTGLSGDGGRGGGGNLLPQTTTSQVCWTIESSLNEDEKYFGSVGLLIINFQIFKLTLLHRSLFDSYLAVSFGFNLKTE